MVKKFIQHRVSSSQDVINVQLECTGDLDTNYTEFVETAGDLVSRLFENYGASLSQTDRQRVLAGVQHIFDPLRN
jgi:hypothetical protein